MRRVPLLLVLVVLAGCNQDRGAIQAVIHYDASVRASCIALEVLDGEGEVLRTLKLDDPADLERKTLTVAIFRGDLPEAVQLQARSLWGNGCTSALVNNGQSALVADQFKAGEISNVQIDLQRPPATQDVDGDGFVSESLGGPDCDDTRPERAPGVQELCDASDELNCDGKWGCDDATCSAPACCRRPASLAFTNVPPSVASGACSPPVTVQRLDDKGQPSKAGLATPLMLNATGPGDVTFFTDASCSSTLSSPATIPAGSSDFTFYVRGNTCGQGEVTATTMTLGSVKQGYGVAAGTGTRPRFATTPVTVKAGECSPAISLEWLDSCGALTNSKPKSLSFSTTANAQLYTDTQCKTPLPAGFSFPDAAKTSVYLKGTNTGTAKVTVEGTATAGQVQEQQQTLVANVPNKFVLVSSPSQTLLAGECSAPVTVRVLDAYDNPTAYASATSVALTSNATADFGFYPEAGCTGAPLNSVPLAAGASEVRFRFKGKIGGDVTVTATASTLPAVNQQHTLISLVRRGKCSILTGQTASANCTITPPVRDLTKSFLVFQATNITDTPNSAFVQCQLKQDQVACGRFGTSGVTTIQWQVVERPTGLRVQHFAVPANCSGNTTSVTIASVSRDKSFLLFSSSQDGNSAGDNDFSTVQFATSTQVDINRNGGICRNHIYSLQVVEWDGLTTSQGSTGAMSGTTLAATGTPAVPDLAHTVLLSTHQASEESDADICNRLVRGELTSDTTMNFSIAADQTCSAPKVPTIAWQRITFPASTLVNTAILTTPLNGRTATSAEFPTAVDPTRTLLLTSSQAHGGQGSGESGYRTSDTPGEASGRLILTPNNKQIQLDRDSPFAQSRWTAYALQLEP